MRFNFVLQLPGCGVCNQLYKDRCQTFGPPTNTNPSGGSNSCHKCKCNNADGQPGQYKRAEFLVSIGWKCLFGGIICQNCNTLCKNQGGFMGNPGENKFRCCGWFFSNGTANKNPDQYPCKQYEQNPPNGVYVGCDSNIRW